MTFSLQDERKLPPDERELDLFSEWEERKKSRAGRGSVCNLARHIDLVLFVGFLLSFCEQAMILEHNVEVIKVILQEQCQRMRFFFLLIACGKGAVGGTFRTCCPSANPHTRGLIPSASDGIWNMLFSTCSHTSRWVRFRFGGCLSLVVAHVRPTHHSPFRVLRTSLIVSASPLGSTSTAVCCASLTSNSSPPDIGRAVSSQRAAIREARGDLQPPHAV